MATSKTSTLTFRIQPALKEALRVVAEQEHRSIANMVEVMIRDYCGRAGVPFQDASLKPRVRRPADRVQPQHDHGAPPRDSDPGRSADDRPTLPPVPLPGGRTS